MAELSSAVTTAKDEISVAYTAAIGDAISSLEHSMKAWVSDQLKGYCTIAEVEGRLAVLQNVVSANDKALQADLSDLAEALEAAKAQTTAAYKKAIEQAINDNEGVVDGKIAVAIAEANVRVEDDIEQINESIAAIESRLAKVEGDIATIGEQITNINNTITVLEDAKEELQDYIKSLQNTAAGLQQSINSLHSQISDVETALEDEVSEAKAELLDELAALQADMEKELSLITKTIFSLQEKDDELDGEIAALKTYVDKELANNKDWANATFATLEQYSALATEVASVKAQMTGINQSVNSLESRINDKVENDIAQALSGFNSVIQNKVNEVTATCSSAISEAVDEITASYTADIQNAFSALEYKMMNWVNVQLQDYCTINEVYGQLSALRNEIANGDDALLDEIENLQDAVSKSKDELVSIFRGIALSAIEDNNGIINSRISAEIAQAVARVDNDIKVIAEEITSIKNRLTKVEGDIAAINGQISNINNTLQSLRNAHDELQSYVGYLQSVASNLQQSMVEIDDKIDEVEDALQGEVSAAKAEMIARLSALRSEVMEELTQINSAVSVLHGKDAELTNKITVLQSYVDTELANNKNWANATFATLQHQNALASDVSAIKAQIAAINQNISALEARMNAKISENIEVAISALDSDVKQKISELTSAFTAAVAKAKSDITAAYTADIQNAVSALEARMTNWVNAKFAGYYTIEEVDAMLATMQSTINGQLASQKAYLENLITSLSNEMESQITTNRGLIASLTGRLNEMANTTAAEYANMIAENAAAIAANAQSIQQSNAFTASVKAAVEANTALIAQNKSAIEGLRVTTNASITKNATDIATNAENIAANAALIAQNTLAINNNAQATAKNAYDISQLKQNLATIKDEITASYRSAINSAINTYNGQITENIASQLSTVNTRINSEVASINSAVAALNSRVATLESEVGNISQQINYILGEIARFKQTVSNLMNHIQSVTYIPKYSDGMATMTKNVGVDEGVVELDFQVSPKDVVADIAANWQSVLSVKAVYTQTRAVSFIELPVLSCLADAANGVITVTASGENLSDMFFDGVQQANTALYISDGNNSITSDYVKMLGWISDNIYIRDANFKNYLVENFDANNDNEISNAEALSITEINVGSYHTPIASLSGIEYMTNLEVLNCADNRINHLDLSYNSKLHTVYAQDNLIETVLFPASLVEVNFENNKIKKIDLSACKSLVLARFNNNNLSGNVDISPCKNLTNIYLFNNNISNIYVWDSCTNTNCSISYDYEKSLVKYKNQNVVSKFFIGQYIPLGRGGIVVSIANEGANAKAMSVEEESLTWSEANAWCQKYGDGWYLSSPSYITTISTYASVYTAIQFGGYKAVTVASYQLHDDYYGMTYHYSYLYWSSSKGYSDKYYSYYYYKNNGAYTSKGFEIVNTEKLKVRAFVNL